MPCISEKKKQKISEQILHHLFTVSPQALFTSKIAEEIARDEEFTKNLLQELNKKSLIAKIDKNSFGEIYSRRQRWRLSDAAFKAYAKHQ